MRRGAGPAGVFGRAIAACMALAAIAAGPCAAQAQSTPSVSAPNAQKIQLRWNVRIPMRDGVTLSALLYLPKDQAGPAPCLVTMTPYTAQTYHGDGVYFAAGGLPFLSVDVRGRGNSGGEFQILKQDAADTADVIEWAAKQPWCNGKVATWGASIAGYSQWAGAKLHPPHLAAMVPVASPYMGVDYPGKGNIRSAGILPASLWISGKAAQTAIMADGAFWSGVLRSRFEAGAPFITLGETFGDPGDIALPFAEWEQHPAIDAYWDAFTPTKAQFAAIDMPILSITGLYDAVQMGALAFYRRHMEAASPHAQGQHYLVIGPWDHAGTRVPRPEVGGLKVGPAGLVDLQRLQLDWYEWTLNGGPKPAFLKKAVAYYVAGADRWRYADSLAAVTAEARPYRLGSAGDATDVTGSGSLAKAAAGAPDHYVYDPRDVSGAALESQVNPASLTDQRLVLAAKGKHLVYQSAAFEAPTEISGVFRLSAWIAIDQPDTDFAVAVYEIAPDGSSILLATDQKRARYRLSERQASLVATKAPQLYDFDHFTFASRRIAAGSRLRLVIGPINSIGSQKNYNSGGEVSRETFKDARPVTVSLWHDRAHPSTLFVPIGQPDDQAESTVQ